MDIKKNLASYVYRHDGRYCLTSSLIDTKGDVALRNGNGDLDELNLLEIRLLADLCSRDDPRSSSSIASIIEEEQVTVENTVKLLIQLGFAEVHCSGYQATTRGRKIIAELALEVMKLDKFKYTQGLDEIESLEKSLNVEAC